MADAERFWCEHGDEFALDDDGYLRDPEALFFTVSLNPSAVATSSFVDKRCLVLLSEPGIGKTRVPPRHRASPRERTRALKCDGRAQTSSFG
jgi:hypothetical protein